ncbi:MFS transporter [Burkholderia sp. WAC0059]|uniref:MFS transporter n=1 Tax=Burkholderia sp. WAC0059 TaxID=2066022 RepID=UPI000C7EA677|nr:MFS transporter [Burkholderia sp. WAC0059]PLZ02849.1 MFS transporter [Burkholderia sp. WAC0059]
MPRARWTMIAMCFAASAINYIDRANLAVAAPFIQRELHLNAAAMSFVLGAFFWTYAAMQIPFGWLADRIGARVTMAVSVVWWSAFTMLTGAMRSVPGLVAARLLLGAGEAGAYPACTKVVSTWFPRSERGLASGIFTSGVEIGAALSLPVVAWAIARFGWKWSFLVTGTFGFAWVVVWLLVYRDPERHPRVEPAELHALQLARGAQDAPDADAPNLRWAALLRHRTIVGMMLGFFCMNFVKYFFITWFPTYLMSARGFSLAQLGTLGMLPALCAIPASWIGGGTSDLLFRRGWSMTAARKTCLVAGMLLSSAITLCAFADSRTVALALFVVTYFSLSFTSANAWSLPADVAPTPRHVATLSAVQNTASNVAGILTSTFTGVMLTLTHGSFVVPLVTAGLFCVIGACSYLFVVGPVEPIRPDGPSRCPHPQLGAA